jgi:hypothetical protein
VTVPHADLAARLTLFEGSNKVAAGSHKRKDTSRTGTSSRATEGSQAPAVGVSDSQSACKQAGYEFNEEAYDQVTSSGYDVEGTASEAAAREQFDFAGTVLKKGEVEALISNHLTQPIDAPEPSSTEVRPAFQQGIR